MTRIIVELKDGTKVVNDPTRGLNFESVSQLLEALFELSYIYIATTEKLHKIYKDEVSTVYEVGVIE